MTPRNDIKTRWPADAEGVGGGLAATTGSGLPVWLVIGYSGAGKSTFAEHVAQTRDWLHIELDVPAQRYHVTLAQYDLAATFTPARLDRAAGA